MNPNIELRWLLSVERGSTLQYRTRKLVIEDIMGMSRYVDWSEWLDVPTVQHDGTYPGFLRGDQNIQEQRSDE